MTDSSPTTKSKPLHEDFSFWIVVVVWVVTLNVIQLSYGLPWLQARVLAARPAPRTSSQFIERTTTNPKLDYGKKTYPWQTPSPDPQKLNAASQVIIIPSEYKAPSGGWTFCTGPDNAMGIRVSSASVVQVAYLPFNYSRIIFPDGPPPPGDFDFIANLPGGGIAALQKEIEKQWGLVSSKEIRNTNVVVLTLDHSGAPGLKPPTMPDASLSVQTGNFFFHNSTLTQLDNLLETMLHTPVIDETGLRGPFDIQMPRLPAGQPGAEAVQKYLLEQYGLQLIQSNAPVEYLILKKGPAHE